MTWLLLPFLAFGTFWFWSIALCVFLFVSWLVYDTSKGSYRSKSPYYYYQFICGILIFKWVVTNPFWMFFLGLVYGTAGVAVSFVKWRTFLKKRHSNGWPKPIFETERPRIVRWISYWPFELFWTGLHDVPYQFVDEVVKSLGKSYQNMIDREYVIDENSPIDPKKAA